MGPEELAEKHKNKIVYFPIKCPHCKDEQMYHCPDIMDAPMGAAFCDVSQFVATYKWTDKHQWECGNCGKGV